METFRLPKGPRAPQLARMTTFMGLLSESFAWEVTIKRVVRSRSDPQNRYLFGVVYPSILRHLPGWDSADVHDFCLGEHFGWEVIEGMGKKRLRPIRRSSKLSTVEFRDYIDWIQRTMAERGINVPDANEYE